MADPKDKKEGKAKERRPTALKRDMQSMKRCLANRAYRAKVNTAIRALQTSDQQGDKALVQSNLTAIYSLIDKGVKTGVYNQNKAARDKSRLTQRVKTAL